MERDHRVEVGPGPDPVSARSRDDRPRGLDATRRSERDHHWPHPRGTSRRAVKGRAAAPGVAPRAGLLARYRFTVGYLAAAGIAMAVTWPL